jgi:hypothetical protein
MIQHVEKPQLLVLPHNRGEFFWTGDQIVTIWSVDVPFKVLEQRRVETTKKVLNAELGREPLLFRRVTECS